ncbi:MAG: 4-(cytidine 5'-diphospho)-2-C-methyl-D-erythritol kinase [Gemmatimonadetes bacterium]|nr:4-(cytidine 5'-diphospho)-2-C-methyl-D-erythritol kinase [Gemmatimonadota bacterium]
MSGAHAPAQAKVNLALRILARETSGFHQIETVFQRLALADAVTVREAPGRSLDVRFGDPARAADLGPVEQNLAWRAAEAYRAVAGWPSGFAIEIEKWIPVGGGLGGGSADAAAVLRALDALAARPLGPAALVDIAARLGADVAFLASPSELALAWGRGERLLDLPPLPIAPVVLVIPSFGVNTGEAYAALAAHRASTNAAPTAGWRSPRTLGSWNAIAADAVNDFEPVVFERHPTLATVRAQLAALPSTIFSLMSGSGSSLFAVQSASSGRNATLGAATKVLTLPSGWHAVLTETAPAAVVCPI